ncbi:MAG TPA: hypothetical protein VFG84_12605 [Gemmatimonadaceae bacterium]|nr:hypothetical protein [Gemmatimonadaceae bacterium]
MMGARPRATLVRVVAAGVAVVAIFACGDLLTDPDAVASMSVTRAYPSIVVGDVLRDSSGVEAPLLVSLANFKGDVLDAGTVTVSSLDSLLEIEPGGLPRALGESGARGRIAISAGGLQVLDTIPITVPPDSVEPSVEADTVRTLSGTAIELYGSKELSVRVLNAGTDPAITVNGWVVSFRLQFHERFLSPLDTSAAWLVQGETGGKPSWVDTTAAGIAGRRVLIRADSLASPDDSVIVHATVRYLGEEIRGSPVRLIVRTRPNAP